MSIGSEALKPLEGMTLRCVLHPETGGNGWCIEGAPTPSVIWVSKIVKRRGKLGDRLRVANGKLVKVES